MAEEVVAARLVALKTASDGEPGAVLTPLISRSFNCLRLLLGLWVCGQGSCLVHKSTGLRAGGGSPLRGCVARGKTPPDWRGRHGADLNGQVSDRRRAPHRAEHACRGSIPIIADRVHVRCCRRRRRVPDYFCACAAMLRRWSAATATAARFTARKAVHRPRGARLSARPGGATRRADAVG